MAHKSGSSIFIQTDKQINFYDDQGTGLLLVMYSHSTAKIKFQYVINKVHVERYQGAEPIWRLTFCHNVLCELLSHTHSLHIHFL